MFQLTRASDYALRVMTHLAEIPQGSVVHLPALAYSEKAPADFLSKIMQQLVRAGYLKSHRGATGGYSLERDPANVTLLDVIETIEGPLSFNLCLTPGMTCDRMSWCAIHQVCREAQERVVQVFRSVSLSEASAKNRANRERTHHADALEKVM